MNTEFDKYDCIANLDGKCINNESKGEIIILAHKKLDRKHRRILYEIAKDMFNEDFKED